MKPAFDVHFGSPSREVKDWRDLPQDNTPDDDEELATTPPDVIALLGFDPKEFSKANPYHDPKTGEFTDAPGGAGSGETQFADEGPTIAHGTLSDAAKEGFAAYSDFNDFKMINAALRAGEVVRMAGHLDTIHGLDDFTQSAEITKPGTVYRLVPGIPAKFAVRGKTFTDYGYTSTGADLQALLDNRPDKSKPYAIMAIKLPKGAKVGPGFAHASEEMKSEKEILLPREGRFTYKGPQAGGPEGKNLHVFTYKPAKVSKANPYHDELGRFTDAGGAGSGSVEDLQSQVKGVKDLAGEARVAMAGVEVDGNYEPRGFDGDRRLTDSEKELLSGYVRSDKPPTGETGALLDELASRGPALPQDAAFYRGIAVPQATLDDWAGKLDSGEPAHLDNMNPASMTPFRAAAREVVNTRARRSGSPVAIVKIVVPKGTRLGALDGTPYGAFGMPEYILHSGSSVQLISHTPPSRSNKAHHFVGVLVKDGNVGKYNPFHDPQTGEFTSGDGGGTSISSGFDNQGGGGSSSPVNAKTKYLTLDFSHPEGPVVETKGEALSHVGEEGDKSSTEGSSAVLWRGKVYVAGSHADGIEMILNLTTKTEAAREKLTERLDAELNDANLGRIMQGKFVSYIQRPDLGVGTPDMSIPGYRKYLRLYRKYNPNHDPETGQFTSGSGGSASEGNGGGGAAREGWPKEDNGKAKTGDEIIVYRLGSEKGGLVGRNAGNLNAVAAHILQATDNEQTDTAYGDTITAYRVKLGTDPGEYVSHGGRYGSQGGSGGSVGRQINHWANGEKGILYSFGGKGYQAEKLGAVKLKDVAARVKEKHGHENLGMAGTLEIRDALKEEFAGVSKFNPNHDPETGEFSSGDSGSSGGEDQGGGGGDTVSLDNWTAKKTPEEIDTLRGSTELTSEMIGAINAYASGSAETNDALRDAGGLDRARPPPRIASFGPEVSERWAKSVETLDKAIANHPVQEDLYVYRGMSAEDAKDLEEKGSVTNPGFTSTTFSQSQARKFSTGLTGLTREKRSGRVIRIRIPKGYNALPLGTLGFRPQEQEVILPRNTKFAVKRLGNTIYLDVVGQDKATKFNPNHDPETGEFSSGEGDESTSTPAPKPSALDQFKTKLPKMSATVLQTAHDKESATGSKITDEMINAGRGTEKPTETRTKTDDLSLRYQAHADRWRAINDEMDARRKYHGSLKPIKKTNPYHDELGRFTTADGATGGGETSTPVPAAETVSSRAEGGASIKQYVELIDSMHQGRPSPARMLLEHGRVFETDASSFVGGGKPQQCYMNATKAVWADPSLTYVEGFVAVHGVPIAHAWTTDSTGKVRDVTLGPGSERMVTGYYGVPFKTSFLTSHLLKTKTYGILTGDDNPKSVQRLLATDPAVSVAKV